MPGRSNSTNKYGFSSYIVSPTLGDGGNYSTVQSAMDAAFAAGGGVVLIRPGTYTENLTMRAFVDLVGASVDGRPPSGLVQIEIVGNHTFTAGAGFEISLFTNICFTALAGDLLTMVAASGNNCLVAFQDCGLFASTDPASRAVVMNADPGSSVNFNTDNSQIASQSHCFENIGTGTGQVRLDFGSAQSSAANVLQVTVGSVSFVANNIQLSSGDLILNNVAGTWNYEIHYSELSCTNEAIVDGVGISNGLIVHSTITSNAPSGEFINGAGGFLTYADIVLNGTATGIGGAVSQLFVDWKPYGSTTHVGVNRYDPTQFTVSAVTGNVSLVAPFVPFDWVDQPGLATVNANQGNFNTSVAANSLTLPVAPDQGDVCKFKCTNAQLLTINASGAQTIQFGSLTSIPGGNITSTLIGDAVELTYFAAGDSWVANSIIGTWTLI